MKLMCRAALMVAAIAFILPSSARSEIKEGSMEMGVFAGYNFFDSVQNIKDRPVFGGRFGYNFTSHFGLEGVVEFINTDVKDDSMVGARRGQFRGPINDVALTFYHLDAIYHFYPSGVFNPFVVVGFGGADYSPSISTKNMAAFNVGIGAKYWMSEHVAIRVDVRDYMVTEVFRWTYHNIGATVGVSFALGGRTQKEVAEEEAKPKEEPVVVIIEPDTKAEEELATLIAEEKIIVIAFEDVHFDFNKSTLTDKSKRILKRNMQVLKKNPKAKVRIAGFTSASGTEEYNQKLSERRAEAVRTFLVEEDVVKPNRLSEIGYGKTRPAMYEKYDAKLRKTNTKAAKANRRVLFEIVVD